MTEQKQVVQNRFGANAEKYARSTLFSQAESLDEMVHLTRPRSDWEVLDVATGGGHCTFAFASHVRHVIATDITQPMLDSAQKVAKERGLDNITFEPADAESLPYPDEHFDLVTCRIAAHHFSDAGQAVREMSRVCKPGGLVAVIDGIAPSDRAAADEINEWEIMRDPSHVALLTVNGWSSLFCAAGLEAFHIGTSEMILDFDDHMHRAGCDAATSERMRRGLLEGSQPMRDWMKPHKVEGQLTLSWRLILIIGRKSIGCSVDQ